MASLTKTYADKIFEIAKKNGREVDYWDIRLGESKKTRINYRSKDLEEVTFPNFFGGSVRVFKNGCWGLSTFNGFENLASAFEKAIVYSKLFTGKKIIFSPIKPVKKIVIEPDNKKDFLKINLKEKINLLNYYRDLLWQSKSCLLKSQISYFDFYLKKLFVSSEGSIIEQEEPCLRAFIALTGKKGDIVQQYVEELSFINFSDLMGKERVIKESLEILNNLVEAPQAKGGQYPVVIDGELSGTFIHEAFGHLSEADNFINDPKLKKIMVKGSRFGSKQITIFDDPSISLWGFYHYDDEGVKPKRTVLLDKGILKDSLQSRETAAVLGEQSTGHCRSEGLQMKPNVRMGATCIEPGKANLNSLLSGIKKGYLCSGFVAGMTDYGNFTFTAKYGHEIINGKKGKMVRDIKLAGNLFKTLKEVSLVGKKAIETSGMCGKWGQSVPVSTISPALRLEKALLIGS